MRILLAFFICTEAFGFALLGPSEAWQRPDLGYNPFGLDVGAPKNLGEEYRWNVPTITYGFDRAFVDYFGAPGVAAVDEAFRILNEVPPADQITLTNYTIDPRRVNYLAQPQELVDLKSTALSLVLKELGLAAPEMWTWALRAREVVTNGAGGLETNYTVINRNFDPGDLQVSAFVNSVRYFYQIFDAAKGGDAFEYAVEPDTSIFAFSSVAGFADTRTATLPGSGVYLSGLSRG